MRAATDSVLNLEAWDEPAPPPATAPDAQVAWERPGGTGPSFPKRADAQVAWERLARYGWRIEHDGATYAVSWARVCSSPVWVAYRNTERLGKATSWVGLHPLLPERLRTQELPA